MSTSLVPELDAGKGQRLKSECPAPFTPHCDINAFVSATRGIVSATFATAGLGGSFSRLSVKIELLL